MTLRKEIVIDGNIAPLQRKLADAGNSFVQFGERIRKTFSGLSSTFATIGAVVGTGSLGAAVATMSAFEQLEIRMRSLMGSAAEGERAFAWIKQFATDTPYEVDQISESFMRLKAFGLDPMDGSLKAVTDTAAKMGGGFETVSRISLALGQAWTKQKLQGEEILQLIEAGVPVWDMLAKVTGKSTGELQKMSEKGLLGREVLRDLIDEMGRLADGSAAAQMESLNGQWSNLSDNIKNALDELRKSGGLEQFKGGLTDLNTSLSDLSTSGQLKDWADGVSFVMDQAGRSIRAVAQAVAGAFAEILNTVVSVAEGIATGISWAFGVVTDTVASATGSVQDSVTQQATAMDMLSGAFKGLATFFSAVGTGIEVSLISLRAVTLDVITGMRLTWSFFSDAVMIVATVVKGAALGIGDALVTLSRVAGKALSMDFAGAESAWSSGLKKIEDRVRETTNSINVIVDQGAKGRADALAGSGLFGDAGKQIEEAARRGRDRIAEIWGEVKSKLPVMDDGKPIQKTPEGADPDEPDNRSSRLPEFEAQLADLRTRFALENDLREMSKAQELDYWRNVRDTQGLSAKDRAALSKKISQVELESLREQRRARDAATKEDLAQLKELQKAQGEAAKQQAEVYGVRLDAAKASSLAQIEEAERVAEHEAGLGLISKEQLLATQREIAAERLAIETDYLNQKRALLEQDPDTNPAMLEQIEAQKAEIRRKYDAAIAENTRNQAAQSLQIWQSLTDRMGSLWDQGTQALLNSTLTWSNAMRAIGAQIVSWFATDVVGKQVKAWFVGEVTKTSATQSGVAARTAAESAGALQSVATWAAAAIKNIANSAWEAMAGAWKAMVGIPFIGPVLAPAIAATAFAGVIALAGNIRSAASGYDIPAGLNPMTQLHEEEMVLPKDIANPLRENLAGGGGLGGGVSVHITAMDSRDVQRALMEGGALHKALKNLQRGFAS